MCVARCCSIIPQEGYNFHIEDVRVSWEFCGNMRVGWSIINSMDNSYYEVEPRISFEFVPIPRPHPSTTTYAHQCRPCYSNCAHVFKNCNITNYITSDIAPMPTQNPWAWAWVWAPNLGLCYEERELHKRAILSSSNIKGLK